VSCTARCGAGVVMSDGGATYTTPPEERRSVSEPSSKAAEAAAGWSARLVPSLTPVQLLALDIIKRLSASEMEADIVVTIPLVASSPIVYVTERWRLSSGSSGSDHTVSHGPPEAPEEHGLAGLVQGPASDAAVFTALRQAVAARRACKAFLLNYQADAQAKPFWCSVSVSPILHCGNLILHVWLLQDYTKHVSKLRSRVPDQFCSTKAYQQHQRLLLATTPLNGLAQPSVLELDQPAFLSSRLHAAAAPRPAWPLQAGPFIKRLGWYGLLLQPEHLVDRLLDVLTSMNATCERLERHTPSSDFFIVKAKLSAAGDDESDEEGNEQVTSVGTVEIHFVVSEDSSDEGTTRVSCTRYRGETLTFHHAYRRVHLRLGLTDSNASRGIATLEGCVAPPPRLRMANCGEANRDADDLCPPVAAVPLM